LAAAIFKAMNKPLNIEYIDLPQHLADKYQYFTEAKIEKLRGAGYKNNIASLEEGVSDYIKNYLLKYPHLSVIN
ncbi:MAG: hypothetical protein R3321_03315, partial [Nitrososphaeraceae archaeon]|nr:hypothetical protein [Nitrososphaeraceae archaeon]